MPSTQRARRNNTDHADHTLTTTLTTLTTILTTLTTLKQIMNKTFIKYSQRNVSCVKPNVYRTKNTSAARIELTQTIDLIIDNTNHR